MSAYDLIVVIPVYNECEVIASVLEKWSSMLDHLQIRYLIRAYDDGSRDQTGNVLDASARKHPGRIQVFHQANAGHGPTILKGYREACREAEWVFQTDSDDEMSPDSFPSLWKEREKYDFLIGRRAGRKQPISRAIVSALSRLTVSMFYGRGVWDVNTPYRLMRSSCFEAYFKAIPDQTFAPNVILSGLAARDHVRCFERPVPQQNRKTGEVSIRKWKLFKAAVRSFGQTIRLGRLTGRGFLVLFAVVSAVFLFVSLLTVTRSPIVSIDEVSYSDPGLRLAAGEGFTTSVWYSQNEEPFFAGNVPLHPFLLASWVSLWGESIFTVRSFNVFLLLIATLLVIPLSRRLRMSGSWALLLVLSLWCFPGVSYSCRSARPDMELLVLGLLALVVFFSKSRARSCLGLCLVMALVPFAGLQGCVWVPLLLALAFSLQVYLDRGKDFRSEFLGVIPKALAAILGLVAGWVGLYLLYRHYGVADIFWGATLGKHSFANSKRTVVVNLFMTCFGLVPFLSVSLVNLFSLACRENKKSFLFPLAITLLTPCLIGLLGVYPLYYHYMGDLCAMLLLAAGMAEVARRSRRFEVTACLVVFCLCLSGMPARSALSVLSWKSRSYEPVCRFIEEHIPKDSAVSMNWQTYYALRKVTHAIYVQNTPIAERPVPSIHEKDTDYWIVDAGDVPAFRQDHPDLSQVAAFPSRETGEQGGSHYRFSIFAKRGNGGTDSEFTADKGKRPPM